MLRLGKWLTAASIAIIFLTYANFGPTSLASDQIADYVKNHFVREIIFGWALAVLAIHRAMTVSTRRQLGVAALLGSVVVLPFWVAALFGWTVGGLAEVWGQSIRASDAFLVHGIQTAMLYAGLAIMALALPRTRV